jgi:acyl CoA:acetate/3-ketoacid CoA transferase
MSKLFAFRYQYANSQMIAEKIQQKLQITGQEFLFYQTIKSDVRKMKRLSISWIPIVG